MSARTPRCLLLATVPALLMAGCSGSDPDPAGSPAAQPEPTGPDAAVTAGSQQEPPRGQASIEAWLAAGHHKSWRCERDIFPARLNGAHGRHRICSNDLLLSSTGGNYPVGAASVKELFYGPNDQPNGYAVGIKISAGSAPTTWYWYERVGALSSLRPVADSIGDRTCAGCHFLAPRDYVFIRAD